MKLKKFPLKIFLIIITLLVLIVSCVIAATTSNKVVYDPTGPYLYYYYVSNPQETINKLTSFPFWGNYLANKRDNTYISVTSNNEEVKRKATCMNELWKYLSSNMWSNDTGMYILKSEYKAVYQKYETVIDWFTKYQGSINDDTIRDLQARTNDLYYEVRTLYENISSAVTNKNDLARVINIFEGTGISNQEIVNTLFYYKYIAGWTYDYWVDVYFESNNLKYITNNISSYSATDLAGAINGLSEAILQLHYTLGESGKYNVISNIEYNSEELLTYYNQLNEISSSKDDLINGRHVSVIEEGNSAVNNSAKNSSDYKRPETYGLGEEGREKYTKAMFYIKIKDANGNYKTDNGGPIWYCDAEETDYEDKNSLKYAQEIETSVTVSPGDIVEFYDMSTSTIRESCGIKYDFQVHGNAMDIRSTKGELLSISNYDDALKHINKPSQLGGNSGGKLIATWNVKESDIDETGYRLFYLQIDVGCNVNTSSHRKHAGSGSSNGNYAVASKGKSSDNWIYYFATMKINLAAQKQVKEVHVLVDNEGNKEIKSTQNIGAVSATYTDVNNKIGYDTDDGAKGCYPKVMRSYVINGEYNPTIEGKIDAKAGTYKCENNSTSLYTQTVNPGEYSSNVVTIVYEYRMANTTIHFKKCSYAHGENYDSQMSSSNPHCANISGVSLEGPYIYGYVPSTDSYNTAVELCKHNGESNPRLYQPTTIWSSTEGDFELVGSYLISGNNGIKKDHVNVQTNTSIERANKNFGSGAMKEYLVRQPSTITSDLHIVGEYIPKGIGGNSHTITVKYVIDKENEHTAYSGSCLNESSTVVRTETISGIAHGSTQSVVLDKAFSRGGKNYTLKASYILGIDDSGDNNPVYGGHWHRSASVTSTRNTNVTNNIVIIAECHEEGTTTTYTGFNYKEEIYSIEDRNHDARGVILDEDGEYNTYRGIPSGDSIEGEIRADDYMFEVEGNKVTGDATYKVTVPVTYTFSWGSYCSSGDCYCPGHTVTTTSADGSTSTSTEYCGGCSCRGNHSDSLTVTKYFKYDIKREFEYYTIDNFKVYQMKSGYLSNPLLGTLTWNGNNVTINKWVGENMSAHINLHAGNTATGLTGQSSEYLNFAKTTSTTSESYFLGNGHSYGWEYSAGSNGQEVTSSTGTVDSSGYCRWSKYENRADSAIDPIDVRNDYLRVNIEDGSKEVIIGSNGTTYNNSAPNWQDKADARPNMSKQVNNELIKTKIADIAVDEPNNRYSTTSSITYGLKYSGVGTSLDTYNSLASLETNVLKGYKEKNKVNNNISIASEYTTANKVNDVAVHTPVYVEITSITTNETKDNNQKYNSNAEQSIVLDKNFVVAFTYEGVHRDIQGFSPNGKSTDYEEFMKETYIKFPTDVYVRESTSTSNTTFLKANTWYKINNYMINNKVINVTLPIWADEALYQNSDGIMMTVFAINDHGADLNGDSVTNLPAERGGYREGNNDRIENSSRSTVDANIEYKDGTYFSRTYSYFTTDVVGRVYDFKFTYTDDSNYKNEFTTGIFEDQYIGDLPYPQYGDSTTNNYATALRLGSKIRYDLKTKGKLSANVQIVPTFYWVSKTDKTGDADNKLIPVDAYCVDANGKRIKITPTTGLKEDITVQNANEIPNMNNNNILTNEILNTKQIGRVGSGYSYNSVTNIGKTGRVILGNTERLAINPLTADNSYAHIYGNNQTNASVTTDANGINNILASTSHWYGEFTLPENTWFVIKDGAGNSDVNNTITDKGYVIVFFNIETLDDAEGDYLSYQYPLNNAQWQKEGWIAQRPITLPNGKQVKDLSVSTDNASIVIYDANVNKDGSSVIITH